MLQELSIQNLALIEKMSLNFNTGFTSMTGETGAGKSILLDALGLTLGERSDSGMVRHGTTRADVTATFNIDQLPHVQSWLAENELDDDNQCLMRRTVTAEGRSKGYINGLPVPVGHLKTLGNMLIDIHGQHEHQSLLSNTKQLILLDDYANHPKLVEQTTEAYKHWQQLSTQLEELQNNQADFQSKFELLSFQQQEFDAVSPQEEEFEQLSQEQTQLSHASEIKQACMTAHSAIEAEQGAADAINQAIQSLQQIENYAPQMSAQIEQLNGALIEIQEAATEAYRYAEHIDLDPAQLEQIETRLSSLFGLAKKYNLEPEGLVEKHNQINEDLSMLQGSGASVEALSAEVEQAWQAYLATAKKLTQSRQKSASALSKTITEGMQVLGMPNGIFEVEITEQATPNSSGIDKVAFMVTANKGQPPQALSKVASGGELSRISLAIQVATSEVASLPTLIFDEVDVGIGGGIAEVVGKKMQQLGQHKQVLSITHLAQVASHGHTHMRVEKQTINDLTHTNVVELDANARIEELARMMGGLTITDQTLNHAKEMLENALPAA